MADDPSAKPPLSIIGFERDELAYLAPMACFMVLVWLGTQATWLYPWAYVARTLAAGGLLIYFRKYYTPIRWNYWWLGIIMGVVGIVQWVGMDSLLQQGYPKIFALDAEAAFNPEKAFANPLVRWGWISVRIFGASLVVPFMEELFWRDYLWRRIIAPADYRLARVGEWDAATFLIVSVAFCAVHPQWLTAIGWGMIIGGLLVYTRSLGACIIMHGVTNLLLGLYVLHTRQWQWW